MTTAETAQSAHTLTIPEVLDRAADPITPEGAWVQGRYGSSYDGCWCLLGAIRDAGNYKSDRNPAVNAVRKTFPAVNWPHEWNDAPERTQSEVVAKLREAAALAREQGK